MRLLPALLAEAWWRTWWWQAQQVASACRQDHTAAEHVGPHEGARCRVTAAARLQLVTSTKRGGPQVVCWTDCSCQAYAQYLRARQSLVTVRLLVLARQLASMVSLVLNVGNCCAEGLGFIDPHDISACENLLEAYFMQIDFLLSRLKVLDERIDDSESTIEIELDHRSVLAHA